MSVLTRRVGEEIVIDGAIRLPVPDLQGPPPAACFAPQGDGSEIPDTGPGLREP